MVEMAEEEWARFESTGRVSDYLAYSMAHGSGQGSAADGVKEGGVRDGADHCAYRDGVGGGPRGGL